MTGRYEIYIYIYIYIYVCIYNYIQYHPVTCLDIKKVHSSSLHACYQQITADTSTVAFTRPLSWNVCVQDPIMVKPMYTSVMIQHHVKRTLEHYKIINFPKYEHQLLRENHTAKKHDS